MSHFEAMHGTVSPPLRAHFRGIFMAGFGAMFTEFRQACPEGVELTPETAIAGARRINDLQDQLVIYAKEALKAARAPSGG